MNVEFINILFSFLNFCAIKFGLIGQRLVDILLCAVAVYLCWHVVAAMVVAMVRVGEELRAPPDTCGVPGRESRVFLTYFNTKL